MVKASFFNIVRFSALSACVLVGAFIYWSLMYLKPRMPSEVVLERKTEQRHVIFVKVHKAASSTVQNIMLRFSLARDLNVLLPLDARNHLNDAGSQILPHLVVPHPTGGRFDIMCDHVIFDESIIAPYFPEDAVRVAIVRDPLQQTLSALTYFTHVFQKPELKAGLDRYRDAPLEGFLGHPEQFYDPSQGAARSYINNRMSVDLGFDLRDFETSKKNISKIRAFLDKLEKQFDLILIADYFDESMVLLRRILNWGMKDVMYLEVNTAAGNDKGFQDSNLNQRPFLNSTTMLAFRNWAAIDYALYNHFLTVFLNKIEKEELFQEEVNAFRQARDSIAKFCVQVIAPLPAHNRSISIAETQWTDAFSVLESDCKLMAKREVDLMALAIENQKARIKTSKGDTSLVSKNDQQSL
ncbi:galactose-3-O-sulfotransferase 3 [Elysia marginata]|uniref:Galactose-3-O-sulfotransferase 3 n=1 Tax=Elysia marginata TaxID=1093978 RepID=A0AAV4G3V8_9GAST|nr:galactose-3-O-sulfotransferase 3 [Elysia marginata]